MKKNSNLDEVRGLARASQQVATDFFSLALNAARIESERDPKERELVRRLYGRVGLKQALNALRQFADYAFYESDAGVIRSANVLGSRQQMIDRLRVEAKHLARIADMMEETDAKKAADQG